MRAFIVPTMATDPVARTRPASVVSTPSASIGRDVYPQTPSYATLDANDVTVVQNGVRYFRDGALVGLWRSLRSQRMVGALNDEDPNVVQIEPSWDGSFVRPLESAAAWAERESQKGRFVIAPVFLAYDTSARRYLWSSPTNDPAVDNDAFAVLLIPGSVQYIRSLANTSDNGG